MTDQNSNSAELDTTENDSEFDVSNKTYSYEIVAHLRKKSYTKGYKKGYNRGYVTATADIITKCIPEAKLVHNADGSYSISLGGKLIVLDHHE